MKIAFLTFLAAMALSLYGGDRGFLGVTLSQKVEDGVNGKVTVHFVHSNSGADKAGLKPKDQIITVNGITINETKDISLALDGLTVGAKADLVVLRNGRQQNIQVELGEGPFKINVKHALNRKFAFSLIDQPYIGVDIETLNDQLARFFKVDAGILVKKVIADGPAELAGLQAGDVIVAWNGSPLNKSHELTESLREAEAGDLVNLTVVREGQSLDYSVTLEKRDHYDINHSFDFPLPKVYLEHLNGELLWDKDGGELKLHLEKLHEHLQDLDHLKKLKHHHHKHKEKDGEKL